jgi:hypothetical protein
MSQGADVRSIDSLKEFRSALALFSEDAQAALGAVDAEVRRTLQWLQHDRREYWLQQIKRRREDVASAQADLFRKKLAKTADSSPAMSEQKERLRKAEADLREAEARALLVKKWEPALQQAAIEYRATTRRIKSIATGDVPRALALLVRLIDAIEAYLNVQLPSGTAVTPALATIADDFLAHEPAPDQTDDSQGDDATLLPDPDAPSL